MQGVNTRGTFITSQACLPYLIESAKKGAWHQHPRTLIAIRGPGYVPEQQRDDTYLGGRCRSQPAHPDPFASAQHRRQVVQGPHGLHHLQVRHVHVRTRHVRRVQGACRVASERYSFFLAQRAAHPISTTQDRGVAVNALWPKTGIGAHPLPSSAPFSRHTCLTCPGVCACVQRLRPSETCWVEMT